MPRTDRSPKLNLTDESSGGKLAVDLESFFEFSFWMSEQLENLVVKHRPSHLPPPKVMGPKPPFKALAVPLDQDN